MPAAKKPAATKKDSTDREKRYAKGIKKFSTDASLTASVEEYSKARPKDENLKRNATRARVDLDMQQGKLGALQDSIKADSVKRGLKKKGT